MKLRVSRELHGAMRERARLLGCDLGEIARRALRGAGRVADRAKPERATREGSTVLTLCVPRELRGTRSGREVAGIIAARLAACGSPGTPFRTPLRAGRDYTVSEEG